MDSVTSEIEKRIYSFFNSFYTVYRCDHRKFVDVFLRAYERSNYMVPQVDRVLVEELTTIIDMLRAARRDSLGELKEFVIRIRDNFSYVYVIDCLGLPELYAVWCEAVRLGSVATIRVFINREAVTKALDDAFGVNSMSRVADNVKGFVFKRLDTLLHYSDIFREQDRSGILNAIVGRMKYILSAISLHVKMNTMMIADHGYDIIIRRDRYTAKHTHILRARRGLSKLAPVIMIKFIE